VGYYIVQKDNTKVLEEAVKNGTAPEVNRTEKHLVEKYMVSAFAVVAHVAIVVHWDAIEEEVQ